MNIKRIGIALIIVFATSFTLAFVVKHKAKDLVVRTLEEHSGSVLKYHHLRLNVFRDFPQLHLEAYGVQLEQHDVATYQVDTVLATLSTSKVFVHELHISSLRLIRPQLKILAKAEDRPVVATIDDGSGVDRPLNDDSPFKFLLNELTIKEGAVHYQFADSSYWALRGVDCEATAAASSESLLAHLKTEVSAFDYKTEELAMMGIPLGLEGDVSYRQGLVHLDTCRFDLAHISHQLSGHMDFRAQPYFDLAFNAQDAALDDLLSLLPYPALHDADLNVAGRLTSHGQIKGAYAGADAWPYLYLHLSSDDAAIGFSNKTSKIDHIAGRLVLSHPEGTPLDATVLTMDSVHLVAGDNYLKGMVDMQHLISSPYINAHLSGDVDLLEMADIFPMHVESLEGQIKTDVNLSGKLKDIADENYAAFVADGQVEINRFFLKNSDLPQGLKVSRAAFDFTPASIRLRSFVGSLGRSDLNITGAFTNYIAYIFDDEDLKGDLILHSQLLDVNEFRQKAALSSTSSKGGSTKTSSPFMVPRGLNLLVQTKVKSLLVDGTVLSQCNGKLALKDQRLHLEKLSFNAFDGAISLTGSYDTQDKAKLKSNLHVSARNVELKQAANTLSVLRQALPISQFADGRISTQMSYYGEMDEKGTLDLNHLQSKGTIESPGIHISNNPSLNKLALQLKDSRYKDFTTSPLDIAFEMKNGQLTIAPFDITVVDKKIQAVGWYRVDNTINFKVKTTVKAKEIGSDVAKYVSMLSDANKPLPVTIMLTGDAQAPNVKYDTREAISILRKDVTKNLKSDAVKSILKGFF